MKKFILLSSISLSLFSLADLALSHIKNVGSQLAAKASDPKVSAQIKNSLDNILSNLPAKVKINLHTILINALNAKQITQVDVQSIIADLSTLDFNAWASLAEELKNMLTPAVTSEIVGSLISATVAQIQSNPQAVADMFAKFVEQNASVLASSFISKLTDSGNQ